MTGPICHQLLHAVLNIAAARPVLVPHIILLFQVFAVSVSNNVQIISNGNKIIYASVSENPAGVLPSKAVLSPTVSPAMNPATSPPIFLAKKNAGIIASAIMSTGIQNAACCKLKSGLKMFINL